MYVKERKRMSALCDRHDVVFAMLFDDACQLVNYELLVAVEQAVEDNCTLWLRITLRQPLQQVLRDRLAVLRPGGW
jgi:hypothetical protein